MPDEANAPKALKSGKLEVCVKGIISKSWLPKWCTLYPAWGKEPARIEVFESEHSEASKKKSTCKILSLKDIRKVSRPTKGKAFSLDVITKREKHQFAAESDPEVEEWLQYLKGLITISSTTSVDVESEDSASHDGSDHHGDDSHSMDVLFDENILYESADPKMQFDVVVEPSEDTTRLNLSGRYLLFINDFALSLVDEKTSRPVCIWPYKCIRRYGKTLEMFSFEVGRKSTTGPGSFSFRTEHGLRIFQLAQEKLKKMQREEMLTREKMQLQQHLLSNQNDEAIPRSRSVDSESREAFSSSANRSSLPGIKQQLEEKLHPVVSSEDNRPSSETPPATDKQNLEKSKKAKEKDKARVKEEKAKQKADKKKTKEDKKKLQKTKSVDKTKANDGVSDGTSKLLLPAIDTEVASKIKSLGTSEDGQSTPGALKHTPSPPPTAMKPNFKKAQEPKSKGTATSPQPEELYSMPQGKNVKATPFPRTGPTTRLYEEPDLGRYPTSVEANLDNPYDEVTPPPAGLVKVGPPARHYSATGNRNEAWQDMALTEKEMEHKENYNPHNVKKGTVQPPLQGPTDPSGMYSLTADRSDAWKKQGHPKDQHEEHYAHFKDPDEDLYEPVTDAMGMAQAGSEPRAINANDLASPEFQDLYYDHLQFQSVMARPNLKRSSQTEEDDETYAHTNIASTSQPMVQAVVRPIHQYEEAVFPPK